MYDAGQCTFWWILAVLVSRHFPSTSFPSKRHDININKNQIALYILCTITIQMVANAIRGCVACQFPVD